MNATAQKKNLSDDKNTIIEPKKVFITFGGGKQTFIDAGNRLINQVKKTNYFDKLILYTDEDLKKDKIFWDKHKSFIENNKRGYGYWLWKPYIIKKTMENMNNGDILLYLDCGCEIGGKKQKNLPKFFDLVKKDKIICTKTGHCEKNWVKRDLLVLLDLEDSKFIKTQQYQAGVVMYYICNMTRTIIDFWYNIGNNYHMIDDSPSIKQNYNCFIEHRHDQSIFSLLIKKYNILSNKFLNECVYISRNKRGKSIYGF